MIDPVDAVHLGRQFRVVRMKRRMRQSDVAAMAGVATTVVGDIERGAAASVRLQQLERVAGALQLELIVAVRGRGAEVDRLLSGGHAALQAQVAVLIRGAPGWEAAAEVSYSEWGERGSIDLVGWHAASRSALIVEIKTEIVDPGAHARQVDTYRRLAPTVARQRGWDARAISTWVVVAESSQNRRRVRRFGSLLRPSDAVGGRAMHRWLANPVGEVNGFSFLALRSADGDDGARPSLGNRVRLSPREHPAGARGTAPEDDRSEDHG